MKKFIFLKKEEAFRVIIKTLCNAFFFWLVCERILKAWCTSCHTPGNTQLDFCFSATVIFFDQNKTTLILCIEITRKKDFYPQNPRTLVQCCGGGEQNSLDPTALNAGGFGLVSLKRSPLI